MKKLTKIILGFSILGVMSFSDNVTESEVYICGQNGVKSYHFKQNCRGLSNCQRGTYKVTLSTAKAKGLKICGWEDY